MGSRFAAAAASALALLLFLCATAAAQMLPDAERHLRAGLEHFTAKRYDAAIAELKAGYAVDPKPEFLYAWAQAERLRGNCNAAVPLYQRYLASGVTAEQAKLAADHLAACTAAAPPPPESKPEPPPPPPPAAPIRHKPWTKDVVGHVLVGAGAAALVTGGILFATSAGDPSGDSYGAYQDSYDSARTKRTIAIIALGAGAALVAGGIVHYAAWLEPEGGGIVVAGRF